MKKEFVSYELALRLKELGFNEPCFGYYVDGEIRGVNLGIEELGGVEPYYQRFGFHTLSNHDILNSNKIVVTSPTYSQSFRWFREKYGLDHEISYAGKPGEYRAFVKEYVYGNNGNNPSVFTYEDAEEICLEKLIEIVE